MSQKLSLSGFGRVEEISQFIKNFMKNYNEDSDENSNEDSNGDSDCPFRKTNARQMALSSIGPTIWSENPARLSEQKISTCLNTS